MQLAATILARAGTLEGLEVMSLGTYAGTMRGGNTDATVVLANRPITSPPIVPRAWAGRRRPSRVLRPDPPEAAGRRHRRRQRRDPRRPALPSLRGLADAAEARSCSRSRRRPSRARSMPRTPRRSCCSPLREGDRHRLPASLSEALANSLPAYRSQFLESNRRALAAGFDAVAAQTSPAWAKEAA